MGSAAALQQLADLYRSVLFSFQLTRFLLSPFEKLEGSGILVSRKELRHRTFEKWTGGVEAAKVQQTSGGVWVQWEGSALYVYIYIKRATLPPPVLDQLCGLHDLRPCVGASCCACWCDSGWLSLPTCRLAADFRGGPTWWHLSSNCLFSSRRRRSCKVHRRRPWTSKCVTSENVWTLFLRGEKMPDISSRNINLNNKKRVALHLRPRGAVARAGESAARGKSSERVKSTSAQTCRARRNSFASESFAHRRPRHRLWRMLRNPAARAPVRVGL